MEYCEFTLMGIIEKWLMPENRGKSALQIAEEHGVKVEHVHDAYRAYRRLNAKATL